MLELWIGLGLLAATGVGAVVRYRQQPTLRLKPGLKLVKHTDKSLLQYFKALTRIMANCSRPNLRADVLSELPIVCHGAPSSASFLDWFAGNEQNCWRFAKRGLKFLCCDSNCENCELWNQEADVAKEERNIRIAQWYWRVQDAMHAAKDFAGVAAAVEAVATDAAARSPYPPDEQELAWIHQLTADEGHYGATKAALELYDRFDEERLWAAGKLGIEPAPNVWLDADRYGLDYQGSLMLK